MHAKNLSVIAPIILGLQFSLVLNAVAQIPNRDRETTSGYGEAYANSFGKFPSKATKGDRMIADYLHLETQRLSQQSLASVQTKSDWDEQKDQFRQQLFEMLSLSPLPEKTDLLATITGTLDHPEFTVDKLHFQSRPGLYVTANVYVPKGLDKPAPAILYVCGHGPVKIDNVSYGNKVTYQHHGAWFARNGYVCIILDSVQLGEIEGIHHGTHNKEMWWWNSRGYTAAGAEAWNCIRAVDYLQSRSDVDATRIGVTGRSGGGAYSWWVAALDERIKVACPVAGITDLQNHVDDGCVEGHCDCMFMVNTYQWDYAQVAGLVSPRPLLICNTDKDRIFPLDGVVRLHSKVRRIYDLQKASDKLGLLITEGPHKDTQELQVPVMRWFNKWLKGEEIPIANFAEKLFTPQELKVFSEIPRDELTSRCFEGFTTLAVESNTFNPTVARELLRTKTFGAWPTKDEASSTNVQKISESTSDGIRLRIYEFESQPGIQLRIYLLQPSDTEIETLHLEVTSDSVWIRRIRMLEGKFSAALQVDIESIPNDKLKASPTGDPNQDMNLIDEVRKQKMGYAFFAPRGIGATILGEDKKYRTHVQRRFMLLGSTLASCQVWDMLRATMALKSLPEIKSLPVHYQAEKEMTEIACFAAIFQDDLASVRLANPPRDDKAAPDFLSWSRFVTPKQLLRLVEDKTRVDLASNGDE
jgi:dienelactone hydrolase